MVKVLIFTAIFAGIIPIGAALARALPKVRMACFVLLVFFSCIYFMIHIHPLPDWRGTARGYALTIEDIFSSIVFLSMVIDPRFKVSWAPPGAWLYWLYFLGCLVSGVNAIHINPWGFEIVKMLWMYLYFLAIYNFLWNCKDLWPLFYAICGTLFIVFLVAVYQKYLAGRYQVAATFSHQNSLALYATLFGSICLGVLLNEKNNFLQMLMLAATVGISLLLVMFTFSRGGLFCYLFGISVVGICSLAFNGVTGKKLAFAGIGLFCALILLGIAAPRIINRFQHAPEASKMTRVNLAIAATRIANAYKLGVGANNFSEYSGPFREFAVEQHANLKITEETSSYGGIVETIYLLVAAECGWWTLALLLCWFAYYWFASWKNAWVLRKFPCGGISVGIVGGLTANYLQSTMEWVLKQYSNFYQLMLVFALVAVIVKSRGTLKRIGAGNKKH